MSARRSIGIFGGTFDPVHRGHIAIAQDLKQHLQLDELRLVPARVPPHRAQPQACEEDRLAMLKLATAATELSVDDRELRRNSISYTIDTLASMRSELGAACSLVLCMGHDAFAQLDGWHCWRDLLTHAHIAVASRADCDMQLNPAVEQLLAQRQTSDPAALKSTTAGFIYLAQLSQIPVSSTLVRQELASTRHCAQLHPDVLHYIQQRGLYQSR